MGAGIAWALAAPPRGWWILFPVGVGALTLAMYGRRARARLWLGGVAGLVYHGVSLMWITGFSVTGYVGVTVLETILLALVLALVPSTRAGRWSGGWWSMPAALMVLQAVQQRFPFGGFPLPSLVLSQAGGPFAGAAPLGGSLLVTGLAATGGVALVAVLLGRDQRRRVTGLAAFLAAVTLPMIVASTVTTTPTRTIDAAIVQGGGPRGIPAVFSDPDAVTERHLVAARGIVGSPDLVLLPENVVDVRGSIAGSSRDRELSELAIRLGSPVVVGVTEGGNSAFRNAAVLWGADGRRLDRYEKEHRVPFGEYIPLRALLQRVTDATALVPRDATIGQGRALLQSPIARLGVVISYEVFFSDRVREAVSSGGQIVLVPTNAASYVTGEVPAMEIAAARLRAREFGRVVLQAAPTGYSAVIRADGTVVSHSQLGVAAVLRAQVELRTGLTPYARTGDAPILWLACMLLGGAPLTQRLRYRASMRGRSGKSVPVAGTGTIAVEPLRDGPDA